MSKTSKEELKIAIDELPQSYLDKLLQFINQLKGDNIEKKPIRSFRLSGKFDSVNIRSQTYE